MRVKVSHVRAMCVEVSFRRVGLHARDVCRDSMFVVVCFQDPQRNNTGGGVRPLQHVLVAPPITLTVKMQRKRKWCQTKALVLCFV